MIRYMTDTFYDIWPGNGAGLFLQPRNPHGAPKYKYVTDEHNVKCLAFLEL